MSDECNLREAVRRSRERLKYESQYSADAVTLLVDDIKTLVAAAESTLPRRVALRVTVQVDESGSVKILSTGFSPGHPLGKEATLHLHGEYEVAACQ